MNKKILTGLIVFLVSFSVSAKGFFGNMEGDYKVSNASGISGEHFILSLQENAIVTLKQFGRNGDIQGECTGDGILADGVFEARLTCVLEEVGKVALTYTVYLDDTSIDDHFIALTVIDFGMGKIEEKAKFERI